MLIPALCYFLSETILVIRISNFNFIYLQSMLTRSKSTEHLGGYNTADDTEVSL